MAPYTKAFTNNRYLSFFQDFIQHGIQFLCHTLVIYLTVGTRIIATSHYIKHAIVFTILEWGIDRNMMAICH